VAGPPMQVCHERGARRPMSRSNLPFWAVRLLAAALGLLAAGPALGLVQHPPETSPDSEWAPGINLGPAAATVWRWSTNASAVAIGPNDAPVGYLTDYFITTRHQGGGIDTIVKFGETGYSVYDVFIHPTADLRMVRVRGAALADWAGFYTAADEVTRTDNTAVIGGFGKSRGDTGPNYYTWTGSDNLTQRWGQNKLVDWVNNVSVSFYKSNVLRACFDSYGIGTWVPYESAIAEFDSGGGWFLPVGDQWKVAGLGAYVQVGGGKSYFSEVNPPPDSGEMLSAIRISSYANWIDAVFKRSTWQSSTGGSWADAANWDNGAAPAAKDKWAVFSDSVTGPRGITVGVNTKLGTLRFNTPGDVSISKTGSGELEFSVTIDTAVLEVFNTKGNGALTISAPLKLTSPLLVSHNSTGLLTLSGAISGVWGLTKSGSGTSVLAAGNSYFGGTTVNQGTLRLTSAGALGLLGKATLGGGNLEVLSDLSLTYANGVKATASATINVNRASGGTGQTMTFGALTTEDQVTLHVTGGNGYSLAFSGLASINGLSSAGIVTIDTAGADLKLLGGLTLNQGILAKTGPAALTVAGTQTYGPNTTLKVNEGTLVLKSDAGTATSAPLAVSVNGAGAVADFESSQHLAALTLSAGSAVLGAGGTKALVTKSLGIGGGGTPAARLDLNDHHLIVDYSGASPMGQVSGWIRAGFADATWGGNGICSSAAAANPAITAVGWGENFDMMTNLGPYGPGNPFGDYEPDMTAVLARYTLAGDVNLDGIVDDIDISLLTINYDPSVPPGTFNWSQGDVWAYDGIIDDADVSLQAINYLSTAGGMSSADGLGAAALPDIGAAFDPVGATWAGGTAMGAVPDPGTLVLLGMGLTGLLARRARPV